MYCHYAMADPTVLILRRPRSGRLEGRAIVAQYPTDT